MNIVVFINSIKLFLLSISEINRGPGYDLGELLPVVRSRSRFFDRDRDRDIGSRSFDTDPDPDK